MSQTLLGIMRQGGFGMWPTLLLGVAALSVSVCYAMRLDKRHLKRATWLGVACLVVVTFSVMSNVDAALRYVTDDSRVPNAAIHQTLRDGLLEASLPGVLGGIFLVLSGFSLLSGLLRSASKDSLSGPGVRPRSLA